MYLDAEHYVAMNLDRENYGAINVVLRPCAPITACRDFSESSTDSFLSEWYWRAVDTIAQTTLAAQITQSL